MVQQATTLPLVYETWVPMSYEQWLDWIPEVAHGEWVDGKGIIFVPSREHQWLALLLYHIISRYATIFDLGEVMAAPFQIRLWQGGPVREPDVFFISHANRNRWTENQVRGGVDLAVEFISPESLLRDTIDKYRDYAMAGVREFLLIDPRPAHFLVRLFRLDADGVYQEVAPDERGRLHFSVLPGFWLDPAWFAQRPVRDAEDLLLEIAGDAYWEWMIPKRQAHQDR